MSSLLELVRCDGDQSAFADLYDRTASQMWQLALALTHDAQRAEYIVEQAYTAAWSELRAPGSPVTASAFCRRLVQTVRSRCASGTA